MPKHLLLLLLLLRTFNRAYKSAPSAVLIIHHNSTFTDISPPSPRSQNRTTIEPASVIYLHTTLNVSLLFHSTAGCYFNSTCHVHYQQHTLVVPRTDISSNSLPRRDCKHHKQHFQFRSKLSPRVQHNVNKLQNNTFSQLKLFPTHLLIHPDSFPSYKMSKIWQIIASFIVL